jgi:hypothetical protein
MPEESLTELARRKGWKVKLVVINDSDPLAHKQQSFPAENSKQVRAWLSQLDDKEAVWES